MGARCVERTYAARMDEHFDVIDCDRGKAQLLVLPPSAPLARP
jgi:hypothetical protein